MSPPNRKDYPEDLFVWLTALVAATLIAGTLYGGREWGTAASLSIVAIVLLAPEMLRSVRRVVCRGGRS